MLQLKKTAVSLFACSGIGDLAVRAANADVLVANEIDPARAAIFEHNFPEAKMLVGDVWELADEIVAEARERLDGRELDILFATPPCQGMSKNGRGKLLNAIRAGERHPNDPRNELVIPAVKVALALRPRILVFENVPEMQDTLIGVDGHPLKIVDFIRNSLGEEYAGVANVVEFADYGVPQSRQRLITVFARDDAVKRAIHAGSILPSPTHDASGRYGLPRWTTVRDVIGRFEVLDAKSRNRAQSVSTELHRVPLLDEAKYFWVENTPSASTAFDNQCVNPDCGFEENPTHSARKDKNGINRASNETPIRCVECGELLPRPWVEDGDDVRLMKGFTSAYRRMRWDTPAPTLTRNLSYACSDTKLHPDQNRVLSLHEALALHTVTDYPFEFERSDGKRVSDKIIRDSIGESIPPKGLEVIFRHLVAILDGDEDAIDQVPHEARQLHLI